MKIRSAFLREALLLAAFAVCSSASTLRAAWTSFDLPNLTQAFGSYQAANLSNGRFLYGTNSQLYRQTGFGGAAIAPFANSESWDPSSLAIGGDTLGAIGGGTFGPSGIYTFNPSDSSTPFAPIPGLSIQNYSLVFRNASGLFVAGANGSAPGPFGGNENAVSYVTLDGGTNKVIIDNVSAFSGGIAIDLQGNLYVTAANEFGDPDDLKLYKFTAQQLTAAISGSPLSIADGAYLTTLRADGSIAVDGLGRIWSAGFQIDGIDVYDPADGGLANFVPAGPNDNYVVSTFSDGITSYVGYLNASGTSAGSAVTYGYDSVTHLVPEPAAVSLLVIGFSAIHGRRRRL